MTAHFLIRYPDPTPNYICRYAVLYEDKGRSERDIVGDAIAS